MPWLVFAQEQETSGSDVEVEIEVADSDDDQAVSNSARFVSYHMHLLDVCFTDHVFHAAQQHCQSHAHLIDVVSGQFQLHSIYVNFARLHIHSSQHSGSGASGQAQPKRSGSRWRVSGWRLVLLLLIRSQPISMRSLSICDDSWLLAHAGIKLMVGLFDFDA